MAGGTRMHQTTVRFTSDLWAQLQREAAAAGVSAAQYVRDATLTQLAYAAARRDDRAERDSSRDGTAIGAARARRAAVDRQEGAAAVWAQAQLARERARELREMAAQVKGRSVSGDRSRAGL